MMVSYIEGCFRVPCFILRTLKYYQHIGYFIDCWIAGKVTRKEKWEVLRFVVTGLFSLILVMILGIVGFFILYQYLNSILKNVSPNPDFFFLWGNRNLE